MAVIPTYTEVKTYLSLTATTHDALITSLIPAAIAFLERQSGRYLSTSSNVATRYSTDGQSALVIHDRPYVDPSRTINFNGTTLTEDTDVWFIQDRRHTGITTNIQLRQFTGQGEWYKGDPGWYDKNLDYWARRWGDSGMPNDLLITGIIGHPTITEDTKLAITAMTAYLFRQKDAAGNTTFTPGGVVMDMSEVPAPVQQWIADWRIRTAVAAVGSG